MSFVDLNAIPFYKPSAEAEQPLQRTPKALTAKSSDVISRDISRNITEPWCKGTALWNHDPIRIQDVANASSGDTFNSSQERSHESQSMEKVAGDDVFRDTQ